MTDPIDDSALTAGLSNPVLDSQSVFRNLLKAVSFPGRRQAVSIDVTTPEPLDTATAALCLTLMDGETPVWLDPAARKPAVCDHLRFHCGCPLVAVADEARFAVIAAPNDMPRLAAFDIGSDLYPDRSATLLIQAPSLDGGPAVRLTGPGIEDHTELTAAGLPEWFWDDWAANGALFPTGIDVVLTCGSALVGLPRSIKAEI